MTMKVYCSVVFLKSCWVKSMIRSRALGPAVASTTAIAKLLVELAPNLLPVPSTATSVCREGRSMVFLYLVGVLPDVLL